MKDGGLILLPSLVLLLEESTTLTDNRQTKGCRQLVWLFFWFSNSWFQSLLNKLLKYFVHPVNVSINIFCLTMDKLSPGMKSQQGFFGRGVVSFICLWQIIINKRWNIALEPMPSWISPRVPCRYTVWNYIDLYSLAILEKTFSFTIKQSGLLFELNLITQECHKPQDKKRGVFQRRFTTEGSACSPWARAHTSPADCPPERAAHHLHPIKAQDVLLSKQVAGKPRRARS